MKTIKIMLATTFAICLTNTAIAYPRNCGGFYVGGQLGGGNLHYDHSKLAEDAHTVSDRGFAGRVLAGFDINQNLGLELGYTLFQNPEFKSGNFKTDFSQSALDLTAKMSLPVTCSVSVYATGGLAYVYRDDAEIANDDVTIRINEKDEHLRPVLGVGLAYAYNCRVSGTLGYFRIFGTDDLEDADFYGAGVAVRLG